MNESASSRELDRLTACEEWLGIPPEHLPPNHYELLGLELFESDSKRILHGYQRQLDKIAPFLRSDDSEMALRLNEEIKQAATCLQDPDSREKYDTDLRVQLGIKVSPTDMWPPEAGDAPNETTPADAPVLKAAQTSPQETHEETPVESQLATNEIQPEVVEEPSSYPPSDSSDMTQESETGHLDAEGEEAKSTDEQDAQVPPALIVDDRPVEDNPYSPLPSVGKSSNGENGRAMPRRRGRRHDNFAVQMVMIVLGGIVGLGLGYVILQIIRGPDDDGGIEARQIDTSREAPRRQIPNRTDRRNRPPRNNPSINRRPPQRAPDPQNAATGDLSDTPNVADRTPSDNSDSQVAENPSTPTDSNKDDPTSNLADGSGQTADNSPNNPLQQTPPSVEPESTEPFEPRTYVFTESSELVDWAGDLTDWSLVEGELVGRIEAGEPHARIVFGPRLENFRLDFEVLLVGDQGKAGILVRAAEESGELTNGREVAVSVPKWGQLIDATDGSTVARPEERPSRKRDRWNKFRIVAVGKRLRVEINGEVAINFIDNQGPTTGQLMLQLDGIDGETEVRFRKMRLQTTEPRRYVR